MKIIKRAGLTVDWSLVGEEGKSDRTRRRAYAPRIEVVYGTLPDDEKLVACWIVASEVASVHPAGDRLNSALGYIGWKIESDRLTTDETIVRELFFGKGKQHDAYLEIRSILQRATESVSIVDNYVDSSIFQILATLSSSAIKILSSKWPSDFAAEARRFVAQYPHFSLEVRETKAFHDRFIIIDDKSHYHIGASIKDAGSKVFMLSEIEDGYIVDALTKEFLKTWGAAGALAF